VFAVLVLVGGFTGMAVFGGPSVNAGAITALATAVLGVIGTHIGHMAASKHQARKPRGYWSMRMRKYPKSRHTTVGNCQARHPE
jgi:hypothetical protein